MKPACPARPCGRRRPPARTARIDARAIGALADQVTYPVVVKPRRGTSSVATARADDKRQLVGAARDEFGGQDGGLLVEEYLADRASRGALLR